MSQFVWKCAPKMLFKQSHVIYTIVEPKTLRLVEPRATARSFTMDSSNVCIESCEHSLYGEASSG
jgi:hypothetical protein